MAETSGPTDDQTRGSSARAKKLRTWIIVGAAAVVAVIAAVVISVNVFQSNREQAFLELLRADPESRVDGLPDEQLLVSLRLNCEQIEAGWTMEDEVAATEKNYMADSPLTRSEYLGNVRALFRAADAVCG